MEFPDQINGSENIYGVFTAVRKAMLILSDR